MVVLSFPSYIYSVIAGSGTGEELSWGNVLPPDQVRLEFKVQDNALRRMGPIGP